MSFFNDAYRGTPPWDIGRSQREFLELAESGEVKGEVIDIGCGTGEHAILFATKGNEVLGIDSSPLAIEKARAKAEHRSSRAEFKVFDALQLAKLGRKFDIALDSGLFHVFSDSARTAYVRSLRSVLRPEGEYYMLCFSDKEPAGWGGPRRVTEDEIFRSFSRGWTVNYVRPAKFESSYHKKGGEAWFSKITRSES